MKTLPLILAFVVLTNAHSFYYDVSKFRFVTYRNVWHDDLTDHTSFFVADLANVVEASSECANLCSA